MLAAAGRMWRRAMAASAGSRENVAARFVLMGGVDLTLLLGIGLVVGQWAVLAPGPALAGSALSIVLLRAKLTRTGIVLFALALGLASFRAARSIGAFDVARSVAVAELSPPVRCDGLAKVAGSPVLMHQGGEARTVWDAELTDLFCEGRPSHPAHVRLYGGPDDLGRGDQGRVVVDLAPVQLFSNEGLDDPRPRAARHGPVASGKVVEYEPVGRGRSLARWIDRARAHVRARIEATFVPLASPLARALVLGETDLDPVDDQAFRTSGLAHLLAVSGTHLVLAVVSVVGALTAVLRRITPLSARFDVARIAAAFGIALAWVYADFAGGSGSAWRAAAMLSVAFAARAMGRRPNGPRACGLSVVAGCLFDPLTAYDASFMLSIAATAGLMAWQRPIASAIGPAKPRGFGHWLSQGLATTMAASVGCAPLIALISPTLPVGGLFANLLAVPVGEYAALPVCLAHALLGPLPLVERGAAMVGSGSLLVVRAVARATTELPLLAVAVPTPSAWHFAVLAAAAAGVWARSGRARIGAALVGLSALLVVEVASARTGAPRGRLRITFLDVGQGDSALVDLPNGGAMLVDAGGSLGAGIDPGAAVVAPMLRARRRRALDVVVLTHPHPDHVGGMPAALSAIHVGELWDNAQGRLEGGGPAYDTLMAAMDKAKVPIRGPSELCRAARVVGGATVEVLAPCPGIARFADPNDNSIVLRIGFGDRAALLMGDAPIASEEQILARRPALRADVLKVGHHGSRSSTSRALLDAVRPDHAVISCGVRNRFGHPFAGTLALLASCKTTLRTDRHGSVVWETDGRDVDVRARRW
jgi:competence protein ComEC